MSQPSIWAPIPALLWSWHCPGLAWEQGWLVLPPSWTLSPHSSGPALPNPEKNSSSEGGAEETLKARGLF